ncbi:MerR family transcriptional regulator [Enterococcus faecium]|nr:MerR family transcriptional regulator [Enterococcus faecium]EME3496893.1 MerR family transcriptional regulator [Enterococcus faecium]EME7102031.1 MerR family transcriptional regulator [Enterococcus faecium]HCD4269671.1 MerR family transcriptional regulator [Enterococcus faecium]
MNIKEVSQMYSITSHTLRYYEKIGLLSPKYAENGYRQYTYEDLERLNTIRDLRFFNLSLEEIRNYLDQKNKALTKEMLQFEIVNVREQINVLKEKEHFLNERLELIELAEKKKTLTVEIVTHPPRQIILSRQTDTTGKNLYLELKKLHKLFEKNLHANNQNVFGTRMTPNGDGFRHQVFYCLDGEQALEHSTTLLAGDYLTICYSGTYKNRDLALKLLKNYLEEHQLKSIGPFYEFYLLDFHETNFPEEYISEIEIQLSPA